MPGGAFRKPLYCVANERKSHSAGGGGHHWLSFTTVYSVLFWLVRLNGFQEQRHLAGLFFWSLSALLGRWNPRQQRSLLLCLSFVPYYYIYWKSTFFQCAITFCQHETQGNKRSSRGRVCILKVTAPALMDRLARVCSMCNNRKCQVQMHKMQ